MSTSECDKCEYEFCIHVAHFFVSYYEINRETHHQCNHHHHHHLFLGWYVGLSRGSCNRASASSTLFMHTTYKI